MQGYLPQPYLLKLKFFLDTLYMFSEVHSFQNDYVFKAVFSNTHSEVLWLKPANIKKKRFNDDNFILSFPINAMSSSEDMSVRDEGSSAKWLFLLPVHLTNEILSQYHHLFD